MKKLMPLFVCLAVLGLPESPATAADNDDAARDHVKIEKTAAGGAKVTIVEGTDSQPAAKAPAEAARPPVDTAPHKARLAVLPAVFSKHFHPEFKFSEKIETSGQVSLKVIFTAEHESRLQTPSFTVSLAEAFVASRKFDVLERARLAETIKEIDFGESDYGNPAKVVPMGKALNAEYVVLPEIEVIHLATEVKDVPYVDTVQPKLRGKMIARLRVADTASTKMVAACTEEVQVERKPKANNPFIDTEINNLVMDLYKAASMRMVHRTLETIYPVRLLEVEGGKVVLNRGEGAVNVGDEFEIYSLGKDYVDPDTGETLGRSENKTAVIKVNRLSPKFSEAEIIEGGDRLTGDIKGYLCRETSKSIEARTKLDLKPIAW